MRRVKQGDSTGCGLACVAMLAQTNYKKVRKIAVNELGFNNKRGFYTTTEKLRKLSSYFDIKLSGEKSFKSFDALPNTAILVIKYKEKFSADLRQSFYYWHWVVYQRTEKDNFIFDPSKKIKSYKRRDFGRIKVKWFLEVKNTKG